MPNHDLRDHSSGFNPAEHHVISAASCTTTGHVSYDQALAGKQPYLQNRNCFDEYNPCFLQTPMSILDSVPKAAATDLRKSRSVINNVILSTTGAAKAWNW
jgi:glyceraldehyde 3-phosphate dehydrogenase